MHYTNIKMYFLCYTPLINIAPELRRWREQVAYRRDPRTALSECRIVTLDLLIRTPSAGDEIPTESRLLNWFSFCLLQNRFSRFSLPDIMIRWKESTPCSEAECPSKRPTDIHSNPGTRTPCRYAGTRRPLSPDRPAKTVVTEIMLTIITKDDIEYKVSTHATLSYYSIGFGTCRTVNVYKTTSMCLNIFNLIVFIWKNSIVTIIRKNIW